VVKAKATVSGKISERPVCQISKEMYLVLGLFNLLYRKLKVSDIAEGLLRGKAGFFPLKGDGKAEVSAERQKGEVSLNKIVHEQ
jgi:hypothetical protein